MMIILNGQLQELYGDNACKNVQHSSKNIFSVNVSFTLISTLLPQQCVISQNTPTKSYFQPILNQYLVFQSIDPSAFPLVYQYIPVPTSLPKLEHSLDSILPRQSFSCQYYKLSCFAVFHSHLSGTLPNLDEPNWPPCLQFARENHTTESSFITPQIHFSPTSPGISTFSVTPYVLLVNSVSTVRILGL